MNTAESGQEKAARQCWECLKRRLVCDHTLPHCKKCLKAGKQCPGYDEQKPLQWVQPGKVTSRRRKKDSPPKVYTIPAIQKDLIVTETDTSSISSASSVTLADIDVAVDLLDVDLGVSVDEPNTEIYFECQSGDQNEEIVWDGSTKQLSEVEAVDRLFSFGGRARIEEVVAKRLYNEAVKMLQSEKEPLERLERILEIMRAQDLPFYEYLSNDTSEVVQAVKYYNVRIHPEVIASGELAPNPATILFPLHALHILPPAVHHTLVCLSLNHYIHRLPAGVNRSIVVSNRSKVYHHRGAAIRALSQYVGKDKTRCSDLTIVSILMFMSMELQNPSFADWRSHANGMQKLISMRGGVKSLKKQSPYLAPTLIIYLLVVTLANACSPSWDQIDIGSDSDETIEHIKEIYDLIFPYTLCPPMLFSELLEINQLRHKASASLMLCEVETDHVLQAHDILSRIETFVPEDWAQPGENYEDWLLIGTMFQSAMAIYCTMSLQSLTILPNTLEMNAMRVIHGDRLLESLRVAIKSPRIKRFTVWPLVAAGVEAVYRGEGTRNFIDKSLDDLSHVLGTSSPLKARAVLKRYWQKSEPGWDECFDRAYVFII